MITTATRVAAATITDAMTMDTTITTTIIAITS
jgi:hypothetical protein